jgi:hypothetical protein
MFAFRDGKDWPVPINQTTLGLVRPSRQVSRLAELLAPMVAVQAGKSDSAALGHRRMRPNLMP